MHFSQRKDVQLFNDKKWEKVEKRGYIVGIYELQQYYSYFYMCIIYTIYIC